jgi:hypothetical protein
MNLDSVAKVIRNRDELQKYGGTPLGVIALKRGVFNLKDSYQRRARLVSEWASKSYGEFSEGLYHAVQGRRAYRTDSEYRNGYSQGRQLLSQWS